MGPHVHACIAFLPPFRCLRANSVERMSVVLNEIEMMIEVWSMDYGSTKGKFIGSKLGKGLVLTLSFMNASIRTCRYTAPYIVFKHFLLCQQCCGRNLCFNAQCYTKELTICWLSSKLTMWILKFIYNKFLHYLCPYYVNLCNPKLMIQMLGSESNLTKLAKDQLS